MDCPDFLCARLASTERFAAFEPLATTIIARLQAQPERCALRFRDASITNSALLNKILRLAERLPEAGIGAGVRVGVSLERGPETLVVLLALWLLWKLSACLWWVGVGEPQADLFGWCWGTMTECVKL